MADRDSLTAEFAQRHADKFARILGRGESEEINSVLDALPASVAASIVTRLAAARIHEIVASRKDKLDRWLTAAQLPDAVSLLSRLPREQCLTLVNSLKDRERRKRLLQYLQFPAHSVGALVTDLPVRVTTDTPASEFLAELRALQDGRARRVVVMHPDGRYCGLLDLWRLLSRDPAVGPIEDYTLPAPAIYPETSQATSVQDPSWHDHNWLPVVDHQQRILGGISRSSLFKAAEQHAQQGGANGDLLSILISDLTSLFGELLTRSLSKRGTS